MSLSPAPGRGPLSPASSPLTLSFTVVLEAPAAVVATLEGFFLVLDDRAVELVDQTVDRRVHVRVGALAVYILAAHVHARLDLLVQLLDAEDDVDVDDVVEMVGDARELARHVLADGRRDFQVMPGQVQIHPSPRVSHEMRPPAARLRGRSGEGGVSS